MNQSDGQPTPRKAARAHLVCSHIAAVSFLVLIAGRTGLIPQEIAVLGTTFGVVSIVVMFITRNSDEWISSLWSSGANAGFVAAIGLLLILPYSEGFIDGLMGNESRLDTPHGLASYFAFGAFLIAYNLKRIRGY
ncbi:MAG: hypothetical protein AAFQ27_03640 [Pseudomonadota bacterium]